MRNTRRAFLGGFVRLAVAAPIAAVIGVKMAAPPAPKPTIQKFVTNMTIRFDVDEKGHTEVLLDGVLWTPQSLKQLEVEVVA